MDYVCVKREEARLEEKKSKIGQVFPLNICCLFPSICSKITGSRLNAQVAISPSSIPMGLLYIFAVLEASQAKRFYCLSMNAN